MVQSLKQHFISISSFEKWNTISHFVGIFFGLIAIPILLLQTFSNEAKTQFYASIIYGVSFLFLFIASTTYHFVSNKKRKETWRKIDHISIYYMISGSYLPFMLEYIPINRAIIFLSLMYFLVFLGTIFKIFFVNRFEKFSVFLYIFLGWMILFIAKSFFGNASISISVLVILGGLFYTSGVYFYVKNKNYDHTIWHFFVLVGSILHFIAVYLIS